MLKLSSRYCFELAPKQFENFFVLPSVPAGTNNGERIAASLVRFREEFPWDLATRGSSADVTPSLSFFDFF